MAGSPEQSQKDISRRITDMVVSMYDEGYEPEEIGAVVGYTINEGVSRGVSRTSMKLPELSKIFSGIGESL